MRPEPSTPGTIAIAGSTILVTGGAGFIGSHLVEELLRADARRVVVLDNFSTGRPENLASVSSDPRLVVRRASVLDEPGVAAALDGVELVFHLACLGVRHSLHAPLENHRVNAEGALVVLEAARRAGVRRLVHVSSSEAYGTARYAPMDEEHPTRPTTVYGSGKLAGESYARAYWTTHGMPTVVVRPFNNFGPRSHCDGDAGEVIPRFVVRALAGLPPVIFGDGLQTRDFIYVTDTARALVAIARAPGCVGETLNVGRGEEISVRTLAHAVLEATGRSDLRPEHEPARPGDVRRHCANAARLERLIGFEPQVAFRDGLDRVVDWFRTQGHAVAALRGADATRNWLPAGTQTHAA